MDFFKINKPEYYLTESKEQKSFITAKQKVKREDSGGKYKTTIAARKPYAGEVTLSSQQACNLTFTLTLVHTQQLYYTWLQISHTPLHIYSDLYIYISFFFLEIFWMRFIANK